jgi:hypothetical protein
MNRLLLAEPTPRLAMLMGMPRPYRTNRPIDILPPIGYNVP